MIRVAVTDNSVELIQQLHGLPAEIQAIIVEKMTATVDAIHAKYRSALPKFGLEKGVEVQGSIVIGWFELGGPKEMAREWGGKGYYEILPHKSRLLRFIGARDGKTVRVPFVMHPPSREFRDIRDAIDAALPELEASIDADISRAFR